MLPVTTAYSEFLLSWSYHHLLPRSWCEMSVYGTFSMLVWVTKQLVRKMGPEERHERLAEIKWKVMKPETPFLGNVN